MADTLYANILKKNAVKQIVAITPFDPRLWDNWFCVYLEKKKGLAIKAMRRVISEGTRAYCTAMEFEPTEKKGIVYTDATLLAIPNVRVEKTVIRVFEQDCLDVESYLRTMYAMNPCVLNMASPTTPGGGWLKGAGAQEESIFRRSNYHEWLDANLYPLSEFGGIYSPNVTVFRDRELCGYRLLEERRQVAFIAAAAYANPDLTVDGKELAFGPTENTRNKIRAILNIALANGHDSIVLGAFGCAFCNPPASIARLFYQLLNGEYLNRFRLVAFAILDDHNTGQAHNPKGNFQPFVDVFGEYKYY